MRKGTAPTLGFLLLVFLFCSLPLRGAAYSHVRIVRLSFVQGDVSVARSENAGWTRGMAYLPLGHKALIATRNGVAEVEFESKTFVQLAPGSRLHLAELGLHESGVRVTRLSLQQGTATFQTDTRRGDYFAVLTPHFQVTVPRRATLRVDLYAEGGRVRVFRGEVSVESQTGALQVSKGQMFEWDATSRTLLLTRNPEPDAWDEWTQARSHKVEAQMSYQQQSAWSAVSVYPWSYHSYSYSYCQGWRYDPFLGRWVWSPNNYYGWSLPNWYGAYWSGISYSSCRPIQFWWYPRGFAPGSPSPPVPTSPDPTEPPPAPPEGAEQPPPVDDQPQGPPLRPGRPLPPEIPDGPGADGEGFRPRPRWFPALVSRPTESATAAERIRPVDLPSATPRRDSVRPRSTRPTVAPPSPGRPAARPASPRPPRLLKPRPTPSPTVRRPAVPSRQVRPTAPRTRSRPTPRTSRPPSRPSS